MQTWAVMGCIHFCFVFRAEASRRAVVPSLWLAVSLPLPPCSLLMFPSARESGWSCFYRDRDLEIKAAFCMCSPNPKALARLRCSHSHRCKLSASQAAVPPCCSVCRSTPINSHKTMYLTNKTGIGALISTHQSQDNGSLGN